MQIELIDHVYIADEGLKAEAFDHGKPVSESVAFDTRQVRVHSHVDRPQGLFSTHIERGPGWTRPSTTEEEEAVGRALARALEAESGVPWAVTPVPLREQPPDLRLTPGAPTPMTAHEVEVRHLDEEVVAEVYAGRRLNRQDTVQALEAMLSHAVMDKHHHYDPSWLPNVTLALQVPMPVGEAYVESLRVAARRLSDGFRELWLVADGAPHRVR